MFPNNMLKAYFPAKNMWQYNTIVSITMIHDPNFSTKLACQNATQLD